MMGWIFLFLGIGGSCFWLSLHQPFPEISRRYAYLVLLAGSVLIISEQGPRETSETVPMYFALGLGVLGTVKGSWDMTRTMRDVIVAPFAGGMRGECGSKGMRKDKTASVLCGYLFHFV